MFQDLNLWVLGGILFCTPSILFLLGLTIWLLFHVQKLEKNMHGLRVLQQIDSEQVNVRLGGAEERMLTRADKWLQLKEKVIDDKYKKLGDEIASRYAQTEHVASSVTIAVSDVLVELQRFLDAAKQEEPNPKQKPVDFDKLRRYALDYPDEITELTKPHTLRQCCEGIKPGCHAWIDIGELCEQLWDSHVEQPE